MRTATHDWLLTPARIAIHRATNIAVVADLHLGYAEARRRAGEAIPAPTVAEVLAPLLAALRAHNTNRLVIAGDLFETGFSSPAVETFSAWLTAHNIDIVALVPGNHDRGWRNAKATFPICEDGFEVGGWRIVHGDETTARSSALVQGHIHPCFRWRNVTAPCYLMRDDHLILPAYSQEAAGVNVLTEEWRSYGCRVIVGEEVLDFGPVAAIGR